MSIQTAEGSTLFSVTHTHTVLPGYLADMNVGGDE